MKKVLNYLLIGVLVFALGLTVGWFFRRSTAENTVSSTNILTALRDRGFLVTQTSVFNESVTISKGNDSFWSKILWGQTVKAYGVVEVNVGVDLAKMQDADVVVSGDSIKVTVPKAKIFNSRLVGDVSLDNSQGILKRIFEKDDGYNQSMVELVKQAEKTATGDEIMGVANENARKEIERLVGYMAKDKKVEVILK
jgi:hypothetical protein